VNIFAQLIHIDRYRKVNYYSIQFEEKRISEFEDFIQKHENDTNIKDEFDDIISWLEKIGDEIGADKNYFRHEKKADALPPPSKFIEIDYTENLRLYCMRVTDSIVILFNGAIKTKGLASAQSCPNVSVFFESANKLVSSIDSLISEKAIVVSEDGFELFFDLGTDIII
jgi:hypothetical protein